MNEVDAIRLEQFRQIKREIRGSEGYLIIGIDIGKEEHTAYFGTANGEALFKRLVFENTIEGFEKLLIQEDALKVIHGLSKVIYGVEPTANYHKPLGEHLIKCCRHVVLVAGTAVNNNRKMMDGRWDKNDPKDAANIADLISQGKMLFYEYPTMPLRDLRNLLSLKRRLKKQEHGQRVRIRNHLLAQYFPELDKFYRNWGQEALGIINGKAELRYALFQAALIASNKNIDFIRYYTEKLRGREKEKGIKTKMRVKLAAKLLIIAWTLMKKQEYFDPEYVRIE